MSQYPAAEFLISADRPAQFVADAGLEVAFAGRSNAGKSSAINALVNRRQFARTSKTPGRTQLINFFGVAAERRLVDLPGYGYARVTDRRRDHWRELIEAYLNERRSLTGLFLIMDIRRGLTDFDRQMLALAASIRADTHILLTKADKLKRGAAMKTLADVTAAVANDVTAQLFSAPRSIGLADARARLDAMLALSQ